MPDGLESALAAAAIDALSDKDQMSGRAGDIAVDGTPNELGGLEDEELPLLWERIVARAVAAGHGPALAAAFGVDESALDITHVANAIAAHVASAYIVRDTDWDRFLAGDDSALTAEARRGPRCSMALPTARAATAGRTRPTSTTTTSRLRRWGSARRTRSRSTTVAAARRTSPTSATAFARLRSGTSR
ncbi:MAG: hypothetical protein H6700_01495 [Myxococcales bacterium]|nr:hypothetical protein [Myxococcales bacterium]